MKNSANGNPHAGTRLGHLVLGGLSHSDRQIGTTAATNMASSILSKLHPCIVRHMQIQLFVLPLLPAYHRGDVLSYVQERGLSFPGQARYVVSGELGRHEIYTRLIKYEVAKLEFTFKLRQCRRLAGP